MASKAAIWSLLFASASLAGALPSENTNPSSVKVNWLGETPEYFTGTTFGLPWPRGQYHLNETAFDLSDGTPLQTWPTAYWSDGSLKWTAHAFPASASLSDQYTVVTSTKSEKDDTTSALTVVDSADQIKVNTGKITATFPKHGNTLVGEIRTASGKIVGQNGKLILRSQSAVPEDVQDQSEIEHFAFESNIDKVTVSGAGPVRTLITVRGTHQALVTGAHDNWLPFILRFYLYANSDAIRVVHILVYDGDSSKDFIAGVGLRFDIPLAGEELYNRHVRLAGVDGGFLNEAVRGITGLRVDPGENVTQAQIEGNVTPDISSWANLNASTVQFVPAWNDYSLTQLSPDGFTLKKRTGAGQSWVKIPGATRSGGLAYLGGATKGGLAVGLRDFWKRYPTGLEINNATTDVGQVTVWIYSPAAEPLDLRPYHNDTGVETWADQTEALTVTYEDWEPGFDTPYGIARTNELYIYAYDQTPSSDQLALATNNTNSPPVLFAEPNYIHSTKALGTYWSPPSINSSSSAAEIESHLDFLATFYQKEIEQRRWYGFFDYGDIMHTYDVDRHTWRYDVGGYAWDNSELSPDLFFWNYFLRTGREDVYRFAEALTRANSETDVYHLGRFKGLGTRHGVQHWGDSGKQARISQPQYRKPFYYLTGGDERTGELLTETLDMDRTFLYLDPNRKVRTDNYTQSPSNTLGAISLGTDWSSLSASWLLEWERRGPSYLSARSKLLNSISSIASLKNGFITGSGLLSPSNGTIYPPPADPNNEGYISVSHLSAVFGLLQVIAEITEHVNDNLPPAFDQAWLDYCTYYFATPAEQIARYGASWTDHALAQGHSQLLAWAAYRTGNATLAKKAWEEFHSNGDNGFNDTTALWNTTRVGGSKVLTEVEEAPWLSTNNAANYGVAAIVNLALVGWAIDL